MAAVVALFYTTNYHIAINFNKELQNNLIYYTHLLNSLVSIYDTIKYDLPLFKHNIIYLDQLTSSNL
jgi:hypothetical protein